MGIRVSLNSKRFEIELAKRNFSQNGFAKSIGMSGGYLSQVVNHTRYPSPKTRQRIQDALGLQFDDLFIIKKGE